MDSKVTSSMPFTKSDLLTASSSLSTLESDTTSKTSTGLNDITSVPSHVSISMATSSGNDRLSATSTTQPATGGGNDTTSATSSTTQSATDRGSQASGSPATTSTAMFSSSYGSIQSVVATTQPVVDDSLTSRNMSTTSSTVPSTSNADIASSSSSLSTMPSLTGRNSSTSSDVGAPSSETPASAGSSTVTSQPSLSSSLQNSIEPDNQTSPASISESTTRLSPSITEPGTLPFSSGTSPAASTSLTSLPASNKVPEVSRPPAVPMLTSDQQTLIISLSIVGFVLIAVLVLVAVVCYKKKRFAQHQVTESGIDNISYGVVRPDISHYDEINLDPDGDSVGGSNSHYAEIYAPKSLRDSDHEVEFVENDLYSGSATKLSTFASDRPS